jgi:hypothetical protein
VCVSLPSYFRGFHLRFLQLSSHFSILFPGFGKPPNIVKNMEFCWHWVTVFLSRNIFHHWVNVAADLLLTNRLACTICLLYIW